MILLSKKNKWKLFLIFILIYSLEHNNAWLEMAEYRKYSTFYIPFSNSMKLLKQVIAMKWILVNTRDEKTPEGQGSHYFCWLCLVSLILYKPHRRTCSLSQDLTDWITQARAVVLAKQVVSSKVDTFKNIFNFFPFFCHSIRLFLILLSSQTKK